MTWDAALAAAAVADVELVHLTGPMVRIVSTIGQRTVLFELRAVDLYDELAERVLLAATMAALAALGPGR